MSLYFNYEYQGDSYVVIQGDCLVLILSEKHTYR
jgi:hypothetical protein